MWIRLTFLRLTNPKDWCKIGGRHGNLCIGCQATNQNFCGGKFTWFERPSIMIIKWSFISCTLTLSERSALLFWVCFIYNLLLVIRWPWAWNVATWSDLSSSNIEHKFELEAFRDLISFWRTVTWDWFALLASNSEILDPCSNVTEPSFSKFMVHVSTLLDRVSFRVNSIFLRYKLCKPQVCFAPKPWFDTFG